MTIKQQIKYHFDNKIYCRITRKVGEDYNQYSKGYIVQYSKDFLVMQELEDFNVGGYFIFKIDSISDIRFNRNDKYYDKIIKWEKLNESIINKHDINLTDWQSIFKSIKKTGLNVIIENEDPDDNTFDIGPIIRINKSSVYIHYFNATGFLDNDLTQIKWNQITLVQFDDTYTNTFSKHIRARKNKSRV